MPPIPPTMPPPPPYPGPKPGGGSVAAGCCVQADIARMAVAAPKNTSFDGISVSFLVTDRDSMIKVRSLVKRSTEAVGEDARNVGFHSCRQSRASPCSTPRLKAGPSLIGRR
jgi:hypothetical protein